MKYSALKELILARTREFYREPEAIFWVYVFPILLMVGLGLAFRGKSGEDVRVDIIAGDASASAKADLDAAGGFRTEIVALDTARARYTAGKSDLILEARADGYRYSYDSTRDGADAARLKTDHALQTARGRKDAVATADEVIVQPGSRYIDWLIPGLLGMNIMGGGMWGLGFVTVDFRMRKLLKRFVATPMRRSDFLLALIVSRLLFLIPEMAVILAAGHFLFGLGIQGSLAAVTVIVLAGSLCFSGVGLLIACRTSKIETVSGLMNLIMLPMWLLSGIFFSSERFPAAMQPFVQALPLTQLNAALRAVILDGSSLSSQLLPSAALVLYGAVAFLAALRWFKWQ